MARDPNMPGNYTGYVGQRDTGEHVFLRDGGQGTYMLPDTEETRLLSLSVPRIDRGTSFGGMQPFNRTPELPPDLGGRPPSAPGVMPTPASSPRARPAGPPPVRPAEGFGMGLYGTQTLARPTGGHVQAPGGGPVGDIRRVERQKGKTTRRGAGLGALVGGAVGFVYGGPVGAAAGYTAGGALDKGFRKDG